jgi:hypothetical protein
MAGHNRSITSLAVSPNGRVLASASDDSTVRLWEVISGEEVRRFGGHDEEVTCVAFAPDGRTLASSSWDCTLLIWDRTGFLENGVSRSKLSSQQLTILWGDLAGEAPAANRAMWNLVAAASQGVALCAGQLKPVSPVNGDRLARLIRELDDDQFTVRQKATRELEKLAELAEPALRRLLSDRPSLEARRRAERLLAKLDHPSLRLLQELRALAVLEYIGSPNAREILAALSKGAPQSRLTQEAKASLERLTRRLTTSQ